jgi:hypothetical protein
MMVEDKWVDEDERLPWEMQPDETAEEYSAFSDYRDMGKASLSGLWERYRSGAVVDPPTRRLRTLAEWCRVHNWVERRREWARFKGELRLEAAGRASQEMGDRQGPEAAGKASQKMGDGQARDAAGLQNLAMGIVDLLGGYNEETGEFELHPDAEYRFQDVVRLFKTGFEAERVARGEASQIVEERGRKRDLSTLSDDELDELIGEEEGEDWSADV